MPTNVDAWVARATHAFTVLCLVAIAATLGVVAWPKMAGVGGAAKPPPAPAYKAGEPIDTPAAWYESSDYTLVLIAQSACGACQKAEPYFRTLVTHLDGRARVVMASPGPRPDVELAYARRIGIREDAFFTAPPGLRARLTPTLVVVNRSGRIVGAWEGVGPAERHAALTRAIDEAMGATSRPFVP